MKRRIEAIRQKKSLQQIFLSKDRLKRDIVIVIMAIGLAILCVTNYKQFLLDRMTQIALFAIINSIENKAKSGISVQNKYNQNSVKNLRDSVFFYNPNGNDYAYKTVLAMENLEKPIEPAAKKENLPSSDSEDIAKTAPAIIPVAPKIEPSVSVILPSAPIPPPALLVPELAPIIPPASGLTLPVPEPIERSKEPQVKSVVPRVSAPMPAVFAVVNGRLVCSKKNDHPSKSKKGKGRHMDMECCLDPDEYPNPNCHYSKEKYGKYL